MARTRIGKSTKTTTRESYGRSARGQFRRLMKYERLYAALNRIPGIPGYLCAALLQAYMRRRYCARGEHRLWMGNYCCFECGTLVNKAAWRYWHAVLRDGSTKKVVALNEEIARHMVVHDVGLDAVNPTTVVVHPTNVVSCTPGEVAPDPRAKRPA